MQYQVRRGVRAAAIVVAAALGVSLIASQSASAKPPARPVDIQILNVSDWHGQLDPLSVGTPAVSIGGAAVLKAYFDQHRAANPNTLLLTAGDAVGATPPLSSFFRDEPTIRAMRLMGFDADTLGNHNFDAGTARLQQQIDLARSTTEPGKPFTYLSANLKNVNDNVTGTDQA